MHRFWVSALIFMSGVAVAGDFPVTGSMRERVDFWKKVYTEISSQEAYLHDEDDLSIVYEKLSIPSLSRRKKARYARKKRNAVKAQLRSLARKKEKNQTLNEKELRLQQLLGERTPAELRSLARNVGYQYGLRDRYLKGLERSHLFLTYIRKVFKEQGVPRDLAYLPHVESSFNYKAYSHVGAAGLWQFMRATARLFGLKMNYALDERRDPFLSTVAAARLLKRNYETLGAWPLAITAYNHGAASIKRAVRKLGTKEIHIIVDKYEGRRFGFASQNFYATFMATVEISKDPKRYFKSIHHPPPLTYTSLKLKRPLTVKQIAKASGFSQKEIRSLNWAIRPAAYRYNLYIPRGYELKLPISAAEKLEEIRVAFQGIKAQPVKEGSAGIHIVSRGENLYFISRMYGKSMTDLIHFNQLGDPSRIYAGMKLKIPGKKDSIPQPTPVSKPTLVASKPPAEESKPMRTQIAADLPQSIPLSVSKKPSRGLLAWVKDLFGSQSDSEETPKISQPAIAERRPSPNEVNPDLYRFDLNQEAKGLYTLIVEPEETLGHYADWARVSAGKIRRLNDLSYGDPISLGGRIRIPMENKENFMIKRMEYHIALEEDFYENYRVVGTEDYRVKPGDSIARITKTFSVPLWLLRKHQDQQNLSSMKLSVGDTLKIPQVEPTPPSEG